MSVTEISLIELQYLVLRSDTILILHRRGAQVSSDVSVPTILVQVSYELLIFDSEIHSCHVGYEGIREKHPNSPKNGGENEGPSAQGCE